MSPSQISTDECDKNIEILENIEVNLIAGPSMSSARLAKMKKRHLSHIEIPSRRPIIFLTFREFIEDAGSSKC